MIPKLNFENSAMRDVMETILEERVGKFKFDDENYARCFGGLIEELRKRTNGSKLTYATSKFASVHDSDSGIYAIRIFSDETPLGVLGVRGYSMDISLAPEEIKRKMPLIFPFDGITYVGKIPGYTPEGEDTILSANQFCCLEGLMSNPLYRISLVKAAWDRAEKTGDYSSVKNIGQNNTPEKPLIRIDNHPINLATHEVKVF